MTCPSCGATNEPAAEVCFSCRAVLAAVSRGTLLASRYVIRDFLGRGGMGTVYRAHDRVLDEEVAIKVLRADLAAAPGMAERFLTEIKLARRVSHRNVCRIHEYGEEGGLRFISMELVEGQSLKDLLQAGPLPPALAFDAMEQAARGLAAIHDVGIVHRDLKPANLTRDGSGRVRVMDFGIAKAAGPSGDTTAGYLLGSPEYMSPEQARGRGADFRSDLYALGVVAYELFTGLPPFRGETPVATLLRQIEAPLPLDAASLPGSVVPVLRRALAKDPRERQGSARELADELRSAATGGEVIAVAPAVSGGGPVGTAAGRAARERGRLIAGGVVVAVALGSLWLALPSRAPEVAQPSVAHGLEPPPTPTPRETSNPTPAPTTDPSTTPSATRNRPSEEPIRPQAMISPPPSSAPPVEVPTEVAPAPSAPALVANPTLPPEIAPAGFLLVVVSPWANVTIDGEIAGQTPLARISLAPGAHTVRLTHPEFQAYPRKIVVKSGETTRLAVDLTQDAVRVRP